MFHYYIASWKKPILTKALYKNNATYNLDMPSTGTKFMQLMNFREESGDEMRLKTILSGDYPSLQFQATKYK